MNLRDRWETLWRRIGAGGPVPNAFDFLMTSYSRPERKYHNLSHLTHCLEEFDEAAGLAMRPDEVEVALWFHDAVQNSQHSRNEALSAEALCDHVSSIVTPDFLGRVVRLILCTSHNFEPLVGDERVVVDADLSILGADDTAFAEYESGIRAEHLLYGEAEYRAGRAEFLRGFLKRPSIYHTNHFRQKYEAAAVRNLTLLVERLGSC